MPFLIKFIALRGQVQRKTARRKRLQVAEFADLGSLDQRPM